jgi:hypothetical protein
LKGITILAAASSDSLDNMKESDMLKIKQSANIQIQQIKILNPKYWEIGVQSVDLDKEEEDQTEDEMIQLSTDEAPQRSSALRINPSFFSAIPESYFQNDEDSRSKSITSTHTTSTAA